MTERHTASAILMARNDKQGRLMWLSGITALHFGLVAGAAIGFGSPPLPVAPPRIMGMLVSDAPASAESSQARSAAPSEPKPVRPLSKAATQPPVAKAPPSERAVTAPAAAPAPQSVGKGTPGAGSGQGAAGGGQVSLPRTDAAHLNNQKPVYPSVSRRMGEQGRVLLSVYILPDGSVGEVRLKQSSGHTRLDESAITAVRRWRYVPARRGNEPIPYWYVQPISFSLDE